jgi:hypothetical protein
MSTPTGYIAATIPAQIARVSGTTLFHVAAAQAGDALQWGTIAQFNNMLDPWIDVQVDLYIPPTWPPEPVSGILGL